MSQVKWYKNLLPPNNLKILQVEVKSEFEGLLNVSMHMRLTIYDCIFV